MKNVSKQNLIIALLVLNFVSILGLHYFAQKQDEKIDKLSYNKNISWSELKIRHDVDMLLFGEPLN
ncbi:hypothetical protein ACM46_22725 [Chryseobacterium angstadtii]|uniref:Uncharacterized protein n=1 Tax=Chryseobacterium angstadtii TaxID=558151 RepID=A0A0J7KM08_9FLAO|nr:MULTISPECIES: hypothetical protein [Chryseobacterium]KMQ58365.1 hypothetical protein ACM46_22725 [Chryseobacterium angstadtii]